MERNIACMRGNVCLSEGEGKRDRQNERKIDREREHVRENVCLTVVDGQREVNIYKYRYNER
jgi:hypothetical protein